MKQYRSTVNNTGNVILTFFPKLLLANIVVCV